MVMLSIKSVEMDTKSVVPRRDYFFLQLNQLTTQSNLNISIWENILKYNIHHQHVMLFRILERLLVVA